MKKLTDITVNGKIQDAIIEYFMGANKTPDNKIIWADAKNQIAKCHGDTRDITVFIKDDNDYSKITAIEIRTSSIKKLYQEILEIESQTSEEFIG